MRITYSLPVLPLALAYIPQQASPREAVPARCRGRAQQLVPHTAILDLSRAAEMGTAPHQMG